jgi:hypothetical protein
MTRLPAIKVRKLGSNRFALSRRIYPSREIPIGEFSKADASFSLRRRQHRAGRGG